MIVISQYPCHQIVDTPQEIPFLNILQHLLRIDPKEPISDVVWDTAERLAHRATLLENKEGAARLLAGPTAQRKSIVRDGFFKHASFVSHHVSSQMMR